MKISSLITIFAGSILLILFIVFIPNYIPHTVTFYNAETSEAYSNANIEVVYTRFCISSPCYSSKIIFSGVTDENGSVVLYGHKTSDFRSWQRGDVMYEYSIVIDGDVINRAEEYKGDDSVYLIFDSIADCYKTHSQANIEFNYPCEWMVSTEDRFTYAVNIFAIDWSVGSGVNIGLPSESPDDFYETHEENIESGKMSTEDASFIHNGVQYIATEFRHHGAIDTFIQIDDNHIRVSSEFDLSENDLEGLYMLLDTLSLNDTEELSSDGL